MSFTVLMLNTNMSKLALIEMHQDIANGVSRGTCIDLDTYMRLMKKYLEYSNVSNYELYKPQFNNMKFKVSSPEHSKEIQEALFEMGYKWGVGGSQGAKIMNTETPTLYTYDDGSIMYDSSDYESEYRMFNKSENQEHTIETTKSYKLIPAEIPKETITIDGKTYDKEAVLKRLAELEEVK